MDINKVIELFNLINYKQVPNQDEEGLLLFINTDSPDEYIDLNTITKEAYKLFIDDKGNLSEVPFNSKERKILKVLGV